MRLPSAAAVSQRRWQGIYCVKGISFSRGAYPPLCLRASRGQLRLRRTENRRKKYQAALWRMTAGMLGEYEQGQIETVFIQDVVRLSAGAQRGGARPERQRHGRHAGRVQSTD